MIENEDHSKKYNATKNKAWSYGRMYILVKNQVKKNLKPLFNFDKLNLYQEDANFRLW